MKFNDIKRIRVKKTGIYGIVLEKIILDKMTYFLIETDDNSKLRKYREDEIKMLGSNFSRYEYLKNLMIREGNSGNIDDITVTCHGISYVITGWYMVEYDDAEGNRIDFDDEDIDRLLHENKCSNHMSIADIIECPDFEIDYTAMM